MKVGTVICGAQKCGTSALFQFLASHPHVGVPRDGTKEVHFFDQETHFQQAHLNYAAYERLFQVTSDTQTLLEATPIYLFWAPVAARLAAYNPHVKLLVLLRDPVARAYSQWEMEYSRGTETESFAHAIMLEREFTENHPAAQHRVRSYLSRGFYAAQLRRYLALFEREQMLILRNDQLMNDHAATLDQACDFLGVDRFEAHPPPRRVLPTDKQCGLPRLSAELAQTLREEFREDLIELQDLAGIRVDDWLP